MFGGIGQHEFRRVFGGDPPATPATPSTSPTAGLFSIPLPPPPPNHREDEDTRSDAPPVMKKARMYAEDEWTRNLQFKREINFARNPIRILGRRYPLTKTAYKYVDIAIIVGRESQIDIALGDYHGKEISLTPDAWRDLLALRNNILPYFDTDSDETATHPSTNIAVGNMTIRFGKINNLKTMRFETQKNRITMSKCTVKALFALELCINRIVASLTSVIQVVDTKLARFLDIAIATDRPEDIPDAIRRNEHFDANDLIDCELHALIFGIYYSL